MSNEPWSAERMYELGSLHARLEAERRLEPLLETLSADPVYEFYPLGKSLRGGDRVRRYYEQFFTGFMESIAGYELRDEWVNAMSVVQEYDITVRTDDALETHRVVGILCADGSSGVLGGERIYGSERIVRLMLGPLFGELEDLN